MSQNTRPRRINKTWIRQRRNALEVTAKTLNDGRPNPNYVEMEAEIVEAEAQRERWDSFESWVRESLGMRLNSYPLRTPEKTYDPETVFVRKDASGRWVHLTRDEAWAKYLEAKNS